MPKDIGNKTFLSVGHIFFFFPGQAVTADSSAFWIMTYKPDYMHIMAVGLSWQS